MEEEYTIVDGIKGLILLFCMIGIPILGTKWSMKSNVRWKKWLGFTIVTLVVFFDIGVMFRNSEGWWTHLMTLGMSGSVVYSLIFKGGLLWKGNDWNTGE